MVAGSSFKLLLLLTTVINVESQISLQQILDIWDRDLTTNGMTISSPETKVMIIIQEEKKISIDFRREILEQVFALHFNQQ